MAAADERLLKILLQVQSDLAGLTGLKGGLDDVKKKTDDVAKSAFGWNEAFKFGGANEAVRGIVDAVKEIPSALEEGFKAGVEFNAQLQQVQIGLASILRFSQPDTFTSFNAAMQQAAGYVDLLKQKANELGRPYQDFIEGFEHAQLAMSAITPVIGKQVELYTAMDRAMQAMSISGSRAARDIADLFRGAAQNTAAGNQMAAALHMTVGELDQLIKQHIASGDSLDFFLKLFSAFAEGAGVASLTFQADINRMKNAMLDLEGEMAKPVMEPLVEAMREIETSANNENLKAYARTIGDMVGFFIREAEALSQVAVKLGEINNTISKYSGIQLFPEAGLVTSAKNAELAKIQTEEYQKQSDLLFRLTTQAGTEVEKGTALGKIVKEISETEEQIQSGQVKNVAAATDFIAALKVLLSMFDQVAGIAAKIAPHIAAITPEMQKLLDAQALFHAATYGDEAEVYRAKWVQTYHTIAEEAKKAGQQVSQSELEQLTYERLRGPERQKELADLAKEQDSHRDVTTLLREESLLLGDIRRNQELITRDPVLSAQAKEKQLHNLYLQEQATILIEIAKVRLKIKEIEAVGGPDEQAKVAELTEKLHQLSFEYHDLGFKIRETTFSDGMQDDLAKWVNSFGVASHQISATIEGSINAALQGTNQLLLDAAFRTGNWRQTVQGVERQILNLFLTTLEQMALQQAAQLLHITTTTSAQVASGAAITAAHAPAAAATSISSYGVAALVGEAAAIAAIAAIMAALGGGYRKGGYTGDGSADEIAGPAHKKEFVFTADETAALGVPFLRQLAASAGGVARFHEGGFAQGVYPLNPGQTDLGGGIITWGGAGGVQWYYNTNTGESYTGAPPIGGIDIPSSDTSPGEFGVQAPSRGYNDYAIPSEDFTAPPPPMPDVPPPDVYQDPSITITSPYIPPETSGASPPPMPSVPPSGGEPYTGGGSPPDFGSTSGASWTVLPGGQIGWTGGPSSVGSFVNNKAGPLSPVNYQWFYDTLGWLVPHPLRYLDYVASFHGRSGGSDIGGQGGLTPVRQRHSGGLADDELFSILQRGEFIVQRAATEHYGLDLMHAINDMRLPTHHAGGAIGGAPSRLAPAGEDHHHYLYFDHETAMRNWSASPHGRKTLGEAKLR